MDSNYTLAVNHKKSFIRLTLHFENLMQSISENPLRCDCKIRPMLHFYESTLDVPSSYADVICHSPVRLSMKPLYSVSDDNLNCMDEPEPRNEEFNLKSDLEFREIIL